MPETLHELRLRVKSDDADKAGSACHDIECLLSESHNVGAWDGADVSWEWLQPSED